ncbi:ribokinase [Phyllobacterium myrsinacearum]|uniref:Deoxyribokinase n=1 Tax=Phyllobacterium myrsinacearum TaxID=28101 RepID=A0A2S9JBJ4_9HYPH|nr:ribokinase [Phyllobacterium myrsinacearum]PRD50175.1 ribokinase [Phyllobacterium myrsinacearum]PWV90769.1 ribokinase [Phyllobacterium myrsinacearum]RZU97171.1 ribokinase [Phyllobacterium myrsinacearum]
MARRIAVVGSNMTDLVTSIIRMPAPGETLEAPAFAMGFGGKGANQAVAAARLGAEVMMVTKVGDDVFGQSTIDNLRNNGIDISHVGMVAGQSSGVAPIFVDETGENSILIIKGANNDLKPADIDAAAEDLKQCDLILMQLEVPLETVYYTAVFAEKHGIETILNPAPAAPGLDAAKVAKVTFVVPNESELALLTGMPTDTDEQIEQAAHALITRGIRTVIVTLGSRGARLITADKSTMIEPVKVKPKDTTGAGDAFIGSFARFYVETRELEASLQKAALYAADSITRPGTQKSYATTAEFEAFVAATRA